jgi:hypothetical protein
VTEGKVRPRRRTRKETKTREKVIIPTLQNWAEAQLRNAFPEQEMAKRVEQIYCLDISGEEEEEEKEEESVLAKRDSAGTVPPGSPFILIGWASVSLSRNTGTM